MPNLKFETKTSHFVNYGDLEDFIMEVYGFPVTERTYGNSVYKERPVSVQAMLECGNDTDHTFDLTGQVLDYEEADLDHWIRNDGKTNINLSTVMEDLVSKGHLEAGTYVVQVWY